MSKIHRMCSCTVGVRERRLKRVVRVGGLVKMAIKVLLNEGAELRIRITGESHTALQMFRSRLNDSKDVEYANYFVGHPELDDPEFYLRCKKGKNPSKILKDLCKNIASEFDGLSLP